MYETGNQKDRDKKCIVLRNSHRQRSRNETRSMAQCTECTGYRDCIGWANWTVSCSASVGFRSIQNVSKGDPLSGGRKLTCFFYHFSVDSSGHTGQMYSLMIRYSCAAVIQTAAIHWTCIWAIWHKMTYKSAQSLYIIIMQCDIITMNGKTDKLFAIFEKGKVYYV